MFRFDGTERERNGLRFRVKGKLLKHRFDKQVPKAASRVVTEKEEGLQEALGFREKVQAALNRFL